MKERAKETRATARRGTKTAEAADDESDVLAKIAEMSGSDRAIAEGLHALVKATAPALTAKTWYGMPGYARDGKIVCFFQPAAKFKARYGTLGFNDPAHLDDGDLWPTSFAVTAWTDEVERRIGDLARRAVG
ncbi:iron chaperone [Micromonospora zhanjiangensis]|uniref:Iron chaperone n=1 Tax=Micromonospora zhanjiangensis TaxID=1522057 RepID=A0ABV8KRT5_9ACTN